MRGTPATHILTYSFPNEAQQGRRRIPLFMCQNHSFSLISWGFLLPLPPFSHSPKSPCLALFLGLLAQLLRRCTNTKKNVPSISSIDLSKGILVGASQIIKVEIFWHVSLEIPASQHQWGVCTPVLTVALCFWRALCASVLYGTEARKVQKIIGDAVHWC